MAMMRTASRWVVLVAAERALADTRRARLEGKGRRPSQREVDRLAKRAALEDASYQAALDKLRELVTLNGHAPSPDALLAQAHEALRREREAAGHD
jgi:hypothetical protein